MSRYVLRRLASLVIVLWGVTVLAFVLVKLSPGDPAAIYLEARLGREPTVQQVAAQRHSMGLDRPLVVQYLSWAGGAIHGDLGQSWRTKESVTGLLAERFPRTAVLAFAALLLSTSVALPLGVVAAYRRNSVFDHGSRLGALLGASLPSFFVGYLLMFIFGVLLGVLPVFGFTSLQDLVLPAVTLALGASALLMRLTRSTLLEVLGEQYMQLARAAGLRRRTIVLRHAMRNALIPIITVMGLSLGHLLAGAVIVETIFAWPGLGKMALDAINQRDLPVIQGFVLLTGTVFVVVNLLTDLTYAWADPRVRLHSKAA